MFVTPRQRNTVSLADLRPIQPLVLTGLPEKPLQIASKGKLGQVVPVLVCKKTQSFGRATESPILPGSLGIT